MAFANGRIPTSAMSPIPAVFHTHGTTAYLRADAADAFLRVAYAFEQRFGKRLVAMSFYRPQSDQIRIFLKNYYRYNGARRPGTTDRSFNGATYRKRSGMSPVASPGYSNHGLGTTVDFNSGVQLRGSAEHQWMHSIATQHGWDWAAGRRVNEPWHWEYILSKDRKRGAPKASGSGSAGPSTTVADLATTQATLTDLGYEPGPVDGKLGTTTTSAVKAFQRDAGLKADGIPGPTTRNALEAEVSKLEDKIDRLDKKVQAFGEQNQWRLDTMPQRVLDAPIKLEGIDKGKTSTLGRRTAWGNHEVNRARVAGEQAAKGTAKVEDRIDTLDAKLDQVLAALEATKGA